ncbi:MAG: hypothetical protein ACLFVS_06400 [Candidatus Acetothermia bacterium]
MPQAERVGDEVFPPSGWSIVEGGTTKKHFNSLEAGCIEILCDGCRGTEARF